MANARLARFISEVAPPQFVSIMRNRASKMLDTIHEEEREAAASLSLPPSSSSSHSNAIHTQQLLLKNVHRSLICPTFTNK
ncbi:galactosyltransferase family protein [Perilla frutescens var. hirtella]|uniref:Galactosyltransferase family protein n=1 Tax=Perilla frutescens var. hirtella TaxID=608512 RepID=A0AAD4J3L5_PERFH|nr:galactosyltransferase family protein [Perilla frutescens var. hirtella]